MPRWFVRFSTMLCLLIVTPSLLSFTEVVPALAADQCASNLLAVTPADGSGIVTVCASNVTQSSDGSVIADVAITNNKAVFYNVTFQPSGGIVIPKNGHNLLDTINLLTIAGTKTPFFPIPGNTTYSFAKVSFPPNSHLGITFKKFGDGPFQASLLTIYGAMQLFATWYAADPVALAKDDPSSAADLANSILTVFNNVGFDLTALTLKLSQNPPDYLGALGDLLEAMGAAPKDFGQILGLSSDAASKLPIVSDVFNKIRGVAAAEPYIADYTTAPATGAYDIKPISMATGGTWMSPNDGDTISPGSEHFAVHAFGVGGIDHVNFTAIQAGSPQGTAWTTVCTVLSPTHDDVYECDWNWTGQSSGDFLISFDVYDKAGKANQSPNGIHTIHYRAPQVTAPPPSTTTQLPAAPSSLHATLSSDGNTVTWQNNANNAKGFHIYGTNPASGPAGKGYGPYTLAGDVPSNTTSFIDSTGIFPCYTVKAYNDAGESDIPNVGPIACIMYPISSQFPDTPANVKVSSNGGGTWLFTWTSSDPSVRGFYIYVLESPGTGGRIAQRAPDARVFTNNIDFNSGTCFFVSAVNDYGESPKSDPACVP